MPEVTDSNNPYAQLVKLSEGAEVALIGAGLINPEAIDHVAPYVDASDFGQPFFGLVWQTMLDLHKAGTRLTPMLVALRVSSPELIESLARDQDGATPLSILAMMARSATTVLNAPDHARIVRECRHRRDLSIAGEALMRAMHDPTQPFKDRAGSASEVIQTALNAAEPPKETMDMMIAGSLAALDDPNAAPGFTTGLMDVDRMLGGLVPGDLIVMGGRPSMGKSATGIGLTLGSAMESYKRVKGEVDEDPWGVLFLTHEMTPVQVTQRMLTAIAHRVGNASEPVCYERFRPAPGFKPPALFPSQREGMDKAGRLLPRLPIAIDGRPGMSIAEVGAMIRLYKKKFRSRGMELKVVAADHIGLGKINPVRKHGNRADELGEITSTLKAIAVNEDLCVLALHQLSRANEGRENKRPTLADFRDSGHIEQDADVMIGLYRDAYYLEREKEPDDQKEVMRRERLLQAQHDLEFFVLKNRQGRVGMVDLWAHMGANAIRNAMPKERAF